MQKVKSFTVDHRTLEPGIYASQVNGAITYDIRMIAPKHSCKVPSGRTIHTLEHFFADYFRNKVPSHFPDSFSSTVLYIGPMGCKTGFYLLTSVKWPEELIRDILLECCNDILCASKIPGGTEIECGNHRYFNLDSAKDFVVDVIIPEFRDEELRKTYPLIHG